MSGYQRILWVKGQRTDHILCVLFFFCEAHSIASFHMKCALKLLSVTPPPLRGPPHRRGMSALATVGYIISY